MCEAASVPGLFEGLVGLFAASYEESNAEHAGFGLSIGLPVL
jgi:hypothetical protein